MSANSELMAQLAYIERNRGLDRDVILEAVRVGMLKAAQKVLGADVHVVSCESKNGSLPFRVYRTKIVANEKGQGYISLRLARLKYNPEAQLGDTVDVDVEITEDLGRIGAVVAKQTIQQIIRDAERDKIQKEFQDMVGRVVTGTVKSVVRRDVIVDLGKADAVLREKDAIPGESFNVGDPVRAYLVRVQGSKPRDGEKAEDSTGPGVILSRRVPELVKALFRQECAEIADGTVEILAVARDPGFRTKIAVRANDEKVDPVGACVGVRGARVRNVVEELRNEKIDIIPYSPDFEEFAKEALKPAKVLDLWVEEVPASHEDRRKTPWIVDANGNVKIVHAIIDSSEYSQTIGKGGKNVRLSAQILNVKTIDVRKSRPEPTVEERYRDAINELARLPGVDRSQAQALVDAGYLSIEGILDPANDFRATAASDGGFEPDFVEAVWAAALVWQKENSDEQSGESELDGASVN